MHARTCIRKSARKSLSLTPPPPPRRGRASLILPHLHRGAGHLPANLVHRVSLRPEVDPVPVHAVGDERVQRQRPGVDQRPAPLRPCGRRRRVERADAGVVPAVVAGGGLGAGEAGVGDREQGAGGAAQGGAAGLGGPEVLHEGVDVEARQQAVQAGVDGDGGREGAAGGAGGRVLREGGGEGGGAGDELEGDAEGRRPPTRARAAGGEVGGRRVGHGDGARGVFVLCALGPFVSQAGGRRRGATYVAAVVMVDARDVYVDWPLAGGEVRHGVLVYTTKDRVAEERDPDSFGEGLAHVGGKVLC